MFKWNLVRTPVGELSGHTNGSALIEMRQLVKHYHTTAGDVPVLKGIDLQLGRGEFVAVIGKSGSGKTTLLNMITGIDHPTSGQVFVANTPVHQLDEDEMAVWRGRNVGIVFQFFQLLPTLSLIENVMLPMDFCQTYKPRERVARGMDLLQQVGMAEYAHKLPLSVSGGQQQRVAIARALANDPAILVADEPTGNLDSAGANAIFQLFAKLVRSGKTIVMVTHDNDLARRATRTLLMLDGQIANQYSAPSPVRVDLQRVTPHASHFKRLSFAAGATILHQGDDTDKFHIVVSGRVEAFITDPRGHDIVVNQFASGEYFGQVGLLRGGVQHAHYRAAHDSAVELMELDRELFLNLVEETEESEEQGVEGV
jgi:putative ABC transport system ATP-binding protein